MKAYLYVTPSMSSFGSFDTPHLEEFTERHHFHMPLVSLEPAGSLRRVIVSEPVDGVVFGLDTGLPCRRQLGLCRRALRRGLAVYLHWPAEQAIEVVDAERLRSLRRHWLAVAVAAKLRRARERRQSQAVSRDAVALPAPPDPCEILAPFAERVAFLATDYAGTMGHVAAGIADVEWAANSLGQIVDQATNADPDKSHDQLVEQLIPLREAVDRLRAYMLDGRMALERVGGIVDDLHAKVSGRVIALGGAAPEEVLATAPPAIENYVRTLKEFAERIKPVPFRQGMPVPNSGRKISGTGVYIRTDYWSKMVSGGSYGHTCYVAAELAKTTDNFVCLMGSHYPLLDELGLRQEVVCPPVVTMNEIDLLAADSFYYDALKQRLKQIRPAYIYERGVLGNYAAARLSRDLNIPYILEYNGSEIAMRHSFGSGALDHEALFLEAERLGFLQATTMTVISEHVRDDVVARGGDQAKVLINPNGVDCDEYSPGTAAERHEIRASLGLPDDVPVLGFIGTFGGWHGIDVLAAAMPEICRRNAKLRFLLIGDGNLKPLVHEAISKHGLQSRVADVGRTEQRVGARLLKAADIYLSPHSSHMRDSPFFGSPTKLFEYMAMGGGIVASDLEQLGEVLRPALRPGSFARGKVTVGAERAVLCRPGEVDELVAAVMGLVENLDVAAALGRNARLAAIASFSWRSHVARLWHHAVGAGADESWRLAPTRN